MSTHAPISKHLFTLDGSVLTSGGAKNLAKGQFTIVNSAKAGVNGAVVVSDFAGAPASTVYEIRVGKHKIPNNRTASNSKPYASQTFTIKDIVDVRANFPKFTKQKFDDLLVGFDGINDATAITLAEGQTTLIDVVLTGDHVGFITGTNQHTVKVHFGKNVGETDEDAFIRLVEVLKKQTLPTGVPITELIDIKLVNSENTPVDGTSYTFSTLTLVDDGTSNALGLVQAQYPTYNVTRTDRDGLASVYTILHPTATALANYTSTEASYLKDCADCAAGYDLISQGVVYNITIEDDGADLTTTIDNVPGFVTGSVVRKGQVDGRGVYTVVTDNALTDAEIATYVGTAGVQSTAIITLIGDVKDVCNNATVTSTAWVAGNACTASVEQYKLQLKDDDCDGSRLAELQAYYPSLTIEAGVPTGSATQTVTVSTDGVALVIVVDGTTYTTADAGTTTQTAAAFVSAHAAAILADTGAVVTSATNVITFTDSAVGFPSITSAAQTVGAIDYLTTATVGGCQRVYSTEVITNLVCDECSDIFLQQFTSVAPTSFGFTEWTKITTATSDTAKMGVRLIGKPFIWTPTDVSRDEIPFYETSTGISVSGGYVEEVNNSFAPLFGDIFTVTRLSRKQDRDNLGYHLLGQEAASRAYFDGEVRHPNNMYAKAVLGEESVLKFDKQYVQYAIAIQDTKYSQGVGGRSNMTMEYSVWAELGKEKALEDYINKLAVKAGLPTVQVTAE